VSLSTWLLIVSPFVFFILAEKFFLGEFLYKGSK